MLCHDLVDVVQDFLGDVADVVADGLVGKVGSVGQITAGDGGEIEELPDEGVVGCQVLEFVVIAVAGIAHDPEDKDLPEVKAGTTFVFALAGQDLLFEQFENLAADLGGCVYPLQREKDGSELVAALGWDLDFLDGNDIELRLDLKVAAHVQRYVRHPDNLQKLTKCFANVRTSIRLFVESPLPGASRSFRIWAASPRDAQVRHFFPDTT